MANKTITQLDTAQSLNDNMVIAVQDTDTTYKTTLADVKAYCGGGSGDKYKVGDRVNDDSNNPVGTVSGFKTDTNGNRYAVCCLNGSYRGTGSYYSSNVTITNIPMYSNQTVWVNKETATTNTDYILAMGDSSACNICRSASVTINGVTYSGQLPTIDELVDIFKNSEIINSNDTSGVNPLPTATTTWSSTQYNNRNGWTISLDGSAYSYSKQTSCFVTPVLEIPLEG